MTKFDSEYWGKVKQPEFSGNYSGPLYAPHPDLVTKRNEEKKDKNQSKP
jgi:hypothetical protein